LPEAINHSLVLKISDMKKLKITQVRSIIDRSERQKRTMAALGLKKMNATVEVEATPQILGMVIKVNHLVKVEEMA
jgi:large subunit ribosomal protein L30